MEQRCKVAVLGLGAMGAATVYQLTRAGIDVIGIDRHDPPHTYGSSHGDTRITRLSVGEGPQYLPLVRRSHDIWRELEALTGESLFEQCGVLVMTSSPSYDPADSKDFTHMTIALARAYGVEHEVLDAAAIRERFPQFSPCWTPPSATLNRQAALSGRSAASLRNSSWPGSTARDC